MTRYSLFIMCIMLLPLGVMGQSTQGSGTRGDILRILADKENDDQVSIEVDSLLEANYYKLLNRNKKMTGLPGYRIRIYSESGLGAREEQQRMRARFLSFHPGIDAYNKYDEPYFKVYVGDCRTKSEALILYDKIKKNFPNPIMVPDFINEKSPD
ncbi:MAG: SPOR domain-containing protein [Bacteroidota bacterium]